jgi:hypothetical protein
VEHAYRVSDTRYGYASDTRWIRIQGVSNFYYFRKKLIRKLIRIQIMDTTYQPYWIRHSPTNIAYPVTLASMLALPASPHAPRPPRHPHRRNVHPPPTGHWRRASASQRRALVPARRRRGPSLLAGAEDRPCSPVEFPRPCNMDPALPVSKSPSPFSISS